MKIICVADSAHAWGVISAEQLATARMTENDISSFSYCTPDRQTYALEEDVDLTKYLNKLDSMGIKYELIDRYIPNQQSKDNPRTWEHIHIEDKRLTNRQEAELGY